MPDLLSAPPLPGPYELLEFRDGETVILRPVRWTYGRMHIVPRGGSEPKDIIALRLYVSNQDKPTLPDYWDITSQHTIASLWPYLGRGPVPGVSFKISWFGSGPRGRPTVEVSGAARV